MQSLIDKRVCFSMKLLIDANNSGTVMEAAEADRIVVKISELCKLYAWLFRFIKLKTVSVYDTAVGRPFLYVQIKIRRYLYVEAC